MTETSLIQELQLEVTCSICCQYMEEPVTLDCGHNYCQACISQHWDRVEEEEELKQCPLCCQSFRKRSFRQNKLLANVVGIVQRFSLPATSLGQPQLQDQDQDVRSRSSTLCGVESLGQDPQGQQESFRQRLEILKKELAIVLSLPCNGEMREHLHHFLHDGQQMVLQKLQELEEENGTNEEGQERKEEPGPEPQDKNITWSRSSSKKPLKPHPQPPKPCDCRMPLLLRDQRIQIKGYTVEVTLDPKTANPELVLSSDWRSVHLGDKWKDVPDCHERFDIEPCILASEGFSSGRCYWEVEVGDNGYWTVGVARGSVKRKGHLTFTPEHGFWTVEMHMGKYWALNTCRTLVYCNKRLRRVGIYVDYVEGLVAFHNAKTMDHLYTFIASFTEKIFPFFYTNDKTTPLVINGPTEQTQPSPSSII
ncbi:E3 ubiquitin-protein ligase TRIM39-like [Emydura macquarii macquarii]|uniref:E3 ubiquitin-protein ligase TRIM39-like n=1 Tax=Emydura macquarii macquarii TaxID=1129001 RepID=UPI00352AD89A